MRPTRDKSDSDSGHNIACILQFLHVGLNAGSRWAPDQTDCRSDTHHTSGGVAAEEWNFFHLTSLASPPDLQHCGSHQQIQYSSSLAY